jgi:hypothetical protein
MFDEMPTWMVLLVMLALTIVLAAVVGLVDMRDPAVEWPEPAPVTVAAP